MRLVAENLSVDYGDGEVLSKVSFSLSDGEILCLLGRNGAGKSTLVSCLLGALEPSEGRVELVDHGEVVGVELPRQFMSAAAQELSLYPGLTVRQNLVFFSQFCVAPRTDIDGRIIEVAQYFAIEKLLDQRVGRLSIGQQRLVNTCVAFLQTRPFIVLDEPTAGLDVDSRDRMIQYVKKCASEGAGVVYSTHYMQEVENMDAKVLLLHEGSVLAYESVSALKLLVPQSFEIKFSHEADASKLVDMIDTKIGRVTGTQFGSWITGIQSIPQVIELCNLVNEMDIRVEDVRSTQSGLEGVFRELTGEKYSVDA